MILLKGFASPLRSEGILALTAVRVDPDHVAEIIETPRSGAAPTTVANAAHRSVNLVVDCRRIYIDDAGEDLLGFQRSACRQGFGPSHKLAEELFVDLALNDDSASIETDLALMKERPERRGADSIVHIDVVENNHRIETAKLHYGPLQKA